MNQQPFMIRAALTNVEWAAIVVALQLAETKHQAAGAVHPPSDDGDQSENQFGTSSTGRETWLISSK